MLCLDFNQINAVKKWMEGKTNNLTESELQQFLVNWFDNKKYISLRTSGSTGAPKEISHSKRSMIDHAKLTISHFQLNQSSNLLLCISPKFIGGMMMIVRALVARTKLIVINTSSNPFKQLKNKIKIDLAAILPLQLHEIVEQNQAQKLRVCDNIIVGGAAVNIQLAKKIATQPSNIFSVYGMTETISHIALKQLSPKKTEYFTAYSDVELSVNANGCLKVYAPMLFPAPIQTNDMVKLIDSERFEWLGRFEDVINSGGIKFFPTVIEHKISHLIDKPFFIGGKKDDRLGECIVLCIQSETVENDFLKLRKEICKILDKYEVPKAIYSLPVFCKTASGKIDKAATINMT